MEENTREKRKINIRQANILYLTSGLLQFAVAIIVTIIVAIIFGVYSLFIEDYSIDAYNSIYEYTAIPTIQIIAVFLPVLIFILLKKIDYKRILRLNRLKLIYIFPLIVIGIVSQFVGMFLNYIVIFFLQKFGQVPNVTIPSPNSILELVLLIVFIAVMPSIFEELLTRGIILRAYERISLTTGIVVSAILFAIMHFEITNFLFPLYFGIIIGYIVHRTNSIYSGMIVHFVNNLFGVLLLYFLKPEFSEYIPIVSIGDLIGISSIAFIALIFLIFAIYFIYRVTDKNNQISEVDELVDGKYSIMDFWPIIITSIMLIMFFVSSITKIINM